MVHTEVRPQVFIIPDATLQRAMSEPSAEQPVAAPSYQVDPNVAANPYARQEDSKKRHTFAKIAAGVALASTLFLSGEQPQAEATTADTLSAETQAQSQESNSDKWVGISLGLTALGIATSSLLAARAMARQTRENTANRFSGVLGEIKGDSSGEDRVLRLGTLKSFARRKEYAPEVLEFVVSYLKGRRGSLELLREKYHVGTPQFEKEPYERALVEKRNADREALKLLFKTLRAARKELGRSGILTRLKRLVGADELYKLEKQTGTLPQQAKPRIDAQGINIDFIRDVKRRSFRDADLTGAGMQGNQFTNVIFRNARLCEARFEGSTLDRCSLRAADARATYWHGALIKKCVVDKDTKFGNLPDNHSDAKFGSLKPHDPDRYRGRPQVVLKDLIPHGMSQQELIELIHEWQRNGLILLRGSNHEYYLNPDDDPNHDPQLPLFDVA